MEPLLVIFAVFNVKIAVNNQIIAQLAKVIEALELDLYQFLIALVKMENLMTE